MYVLFLMVILCQACATLNTNTMKDQLITVNGMAQNGKAGALLKSEDNTIYYIDGLGAWSPEMINRKVSVTGNLKVEKVSEKSLKNEQGEWSQGMSGEVKTILRAIWKLQ
jgi:hypothetical protein